MANKFAVITGGSTGIGAELVKLAVQDDYDVLTAADTPFDEPFAGNVETLDVDLSTLDGVDQLLAKVGDRRIDLLCANAGHGLGHAFLDQEVAAWRHVVDTNITGTLYLIHKVLKPMAARNEGKLLVTGSIAGFMPGTYQAVYNGTKAFVDSFVDALRAELKDQGRDGITITTLMPGATETEFFHRAKMDDTQVGQAEKDDPADVARTGWDALMAGKGDIVHGIKNKLQAAASHILPEGVSAAMHRNMAEPGSGS
jgi:uncharacterized protein